MLVFRELRQALNSARLLDELLADLRQLQLPSPPTKEQFIESALLRAGELECGLADYCATAADASSIPQIAARITHLLAQAMLAPEEADRRASEAEELCRQ